MKTIYTLVLLIFICPFSNAQTTYTVNNTPGLAADFTDLQKAIDQAKNGDVIYIQHSDKGYGEVTLNKRLSLYGRSHSLEGYVSNVYVNLTNGASGSKIQGIAGNISLEGENISLKDIKIYNNSLSNLWFFGGNVKLIDNFDIKGNLFGLPNSDTNFKKTTINSLVTMFGEVCKNINFSNNVSFLSFSCRGDASTFTIENNIFNVGSFTFTGGKILRVSNCIFIGNINEEVELGIGGSEDGDEVILTNCHAYNYDANGTLVFPKRDNLKLINCTENKDPLFVKLINPSTFTPGKDDLHLQSNSPAKGAGVFGE